MDFYLLLRLSKTRRWLKMKSEIDTQVNISTETPSCSLSQACTFLCCHACKWVFTAYFHTWHEHHKVASTLWSSQREPCLPTTAWRHSRMLTQWLAADLHTLSAQQQQDGSRMCEAICSWSLPAEAETFCKLSLFECAGSTKQQVSAGSRERADIILNMPDSSV